MIRSELVQLLVDDNLGLSAREVEKIVSFFFDEIVGRLTEDGRVEVRIQGGRRWIGQAGDRHGRTYREMVPGAGRPGRVAPGHGPSMPPCNSSAGLLHGGRSPAGTGAGRLRAKSPKRLEPDQGFARIPRAPWPIAMRFGF